MCLFSCCLCLPLNRHTDFTRALTLFGLEQYILAGGGGGGGGAAEMAEFGGSKVKSLATRA
jgi:hypothetical protein